MTRKEQEIFLIKEMQAEMPEYAKYEIPEDEAMRFALLRSLFNVRPPYPISDAFETVQNAYLQDRIREMGVTDAKSLTPSPADPRLYIWQGDITTLACDAIVNAANSQMLGCFQPLHSCIDNAIHTFAGVQLRIRCHELMQAQGHEEETGCAKITPGYNLPAKYVLHTVGPIIMSFVQAKDRALLASCYQSCLELAAANGCESVAFCCISTGVFRFPADQAAAIAVQTVRDFLDESPGSVRQVIFNVFKDSDVAIYRRLLQ